MILFVFFQFFWLIGFGCVCGVLSVLDVVWMICLFVQDKLFFQIFSERENIYCLLLGINVENFYKDYVKYIINLSICYLYIIYKWICEVYYLFDIDDFVNVDFSIGSFQIEVLNKGRVS